MDATAMLGVITQGIASIKTRDLKASSTPNNGSNTHRGSITVDKYSKSDIVTRRARLVELEVSVEASRLKYLPVIVEDESTSKKIPKPAVRKEGFMDRFIIGGGPGRPNSAKSFSFRGHKREPVTISTSIGLLGRPNSANPKSWRNLYRPDNGITITTTVGKQNEIDESRNGRFHKNRDDESKTVRHKNKDDESKSMRHKNKDDDSKSYRRRSEKGSLKIVETPPAPLIEIEDWQQPFIDIRNAYLAKRALDIDVPRRLSVSNIMNSFIDFPEKGSNYRIKAPSRLKTPSFLCCIS
jgi:hypothetical protein